ncbi:MAG: polysaccharide biosynthesis tyrosine autokinase [Nitrospirae bacterium]|nr:polysaccharide biosynthesis tyrosine autokinase [Nitrospirota bacterium]
MSKIEKALQKAMENRGSQQHLEPAKQTKDVESTESRAEEYKALLEVAKEIDPAGVDKHVVCVTDPYSLVAEQYKRLRAKIIRDTAKDNRNIIMVSSANMSEGKSITSANLAVSIAQELDHTVLLVDADLRRPSLHKYFGINPQYGLSEYLQGTKELSEVLIKTGVGKLVFLPAGQPPENPSELLASARMRDLIKEMKNRYKDRYVILDSSPILVTADAIALSRNMDGLVFVVQSDNTHKKDAVKALNMIKGTPVIGIVMNDVPEYLSNEKDDYSSYRYGSYIKSSAA